MKKVWKFPLVQAGMVLENPQSVLMPKGSVTLSAMAPPLPFSPAADSPVIVVYALVETDNTDSEEHRFQVVGTGHADLEKNLDDDDILEFVGTVDVQNAGRYGVFHIFEVKN